jgi:hypothetical protein
VQGAYADEAGRRLRSTLDAVFDALDHDGVEWCILRGQEDLGVGGDVDLLVNRTDLPRLRRTVARLGFAPIPAWGCGSHAFFLNYDSSSDAWLKLDVVTEMAFGTGYSLLSRAENACLERRRRQNGMAVLDDDDAFWALLLHRLLDKRAVAPRNAKRLQELADRANTDGPIARVLDRVCPPPWSSARLLSAVRRGEWGSLLAFGPLLETHWRRREAALVGQRRVANAAWRQAGRFLRLRYRLGLGVAVLAPDGAGKSTLVTGLAETFFFPVRTLYMGPYRRTIRWLPPGLSLVSRIGGLWTGWLWGAFHRVRGRLVVFDRYPYDSLLPARHRPGRIDRVRRGLLGRACPAPNLTILLDAPGEILYARRGEQNPDVLEAERQAYRSLVPRLRDAVLIDATLSADDVRRKAIAAVWNAYFRRWNRWRAP